jgi:hypothetical protein
MLQRRVINRAASCSAPGLVRQLEEEPHVDSNTGTTELSFRDPDGYYVTTSSLNPA